ncbi:ABC transporter permease subunit [Asanoa sp. WMMD1127]|uniref:ABC transporter permease subunit n=1 Tax=Asanoa sp. WMMD1127 TaxID=3016107 RepID=UPI002415BEC2|nr:ABC transporter permease subunit [Asanoa sp. WMMD1127]MDG4822487.1 ABC transporter permease subunit [Asanoa sp. WMMD1127]
MSLPKAEVRRLFKRRVTRIFLILTLVGLAIFPIVFTVSSQRTGPSQRAAAEAQAQREFERASADYQQMVRQCESEKAAGATDVDERYGPNCGADYGPRPEYFEAANYLPFEFTFRDEFEPSLYVFAAILAMVAFVIGASFVGAEWNSGGMTNLLLWRPRRIPVLVTKLGVLLGSILGVFVVLGALWTAAFWAIGRFDGQLGKLTSGVWQSFALTGARGVGAVLLAATLGFCLASIGRHTAMALGVGIGVVVVSEIGLRIAFELTQVRFGDRYILSSYLAAWFSKSLTLYDYRSCDFVQGQCNPGELVVTWQQAGVLFAVVLVVAVFGALWSIRRRDVT